MKREVFIGSSHEGREQAIEIAKMLRQCPVDDDDSIDPQLWTNFFEATSLTFEALEEMLTQCCAAVFVVRPDDIVRHKEKSDEHAANSPKYMPRGNVLLEFGLVAGRLGRRNVALCRFDKAELPSDLAGMTIIDMDSDACNAAEGAAVCEAAEKMTRWARHLMATGEGIPRTQVFHGYTGHWNFELNLSQWRGIAIKAPSYAVVNGYLDLLIPQEGEGGSGVAYGTLTFRLEPVRDGDVTHQQFSGDLQIFHEIRNIECKIDGTLELGSHLLAMQMQAADIAGEARPELKDLNRFTEPWSFKWVLNPAAAAMEMTGTLSSGSAGGTAGTLTAKKSLTC